MIGFLDTETNGLCRPIGTDLAKQPHLTEYCLMVFDDELLPAMESSSLIHSPVPQPEHIIKITGITDEMLADAPPFEDKLPQIQMMFDECHTLVMQNFCFDEAILNFAAKRIGKKIKWPETKFCTVEQSMHIYGIRLKLSELYKLATGKDDYGAHRAKNDVLAMVEVYRWLRG